MVNYCNFCSFDEKTKKLYFLFFGLIISYIPIIIFQNADYFKEICAFEKLTRALSKILVIIPYYINKKACNKRNEKTDNLNLILNNNIKDYIILIFFPIIYSLRKLMDLIFMETYEFINKSLCLIAISYFMRFYTDFTFYKHKIISFIVFSIFAFIIDTFIYERTFSFKLIILNVLLNILYSVELNYRKYLMDNKYISLYKIICFCGIIDSIILIILQLITIKNENCLYFNKEIVTIPIQYKEIQTNGFIIFAGSIPIFICYTIHIIIFYLLIYNFTATHAVVIDTIKSSIKSIFVFNKEIVYKFLIFLLLIFFSIFSLFIYLEIIIFKFCGLDKDIRKNILKRMDIDKILNEIGEERDSQIENNRISMGNGYIMELIDNN